MRFDGETYKPARDRGRLEAQYDKVFNFMKDGVWYTLAEIADATDAPQASVSARLRDMRKARFGGHKIARQYIGSGVYQYQLELPS